MPGQRGLNPSPVTAKDRDLTNKSETVNLLVNSCVANAHFVFGLPQKKGVNCVLCTCARSEKPFTSDSQGQRLDQQERDCKFTCKLLCCKCSFCFWVATKERPNYCHNYTEMKYVKDVSCVGHLSSVNLVTNVPTAAIDLSVVARLHQFWEKWETLGASPKVVTALREGYTLPFRFRPNPTRSPTVVSSYTNPHKNLNLLEALYQLVNKNAVQPVENQNSLGFYNRLFLVPKRNNRWRPILDLSTLNTFLNTELFKMETPETIRTSLQAGELVTSIDFKDAYFHIAIHSQSRKYMRFHVQGRSYQFKAQPFSLSTAPMEFTVVAKEVKLMALQRGIRIQ